MARAPRSSLYPTVTPRRSYLVHLGEALLIIVAMFAIAAVAQYGLARAIPEGTPPGLADAGRFVILALAVGGGIAGGVSALGSRLR
jgi:hypothetical protein